MKNILVLIMLSMMFSSVYAKEKELKGKEVQTEHFSDCFEEHFSKGVKNADSKVYKRRGKTYIRNSGKPYKEFGACEINNGKLIFLNK